MTTWYDSIVMLCHDNTFSQAPFVIAGGIFGNITGYNFYFYSDEEPTSSNSTCVADMILCEYMVNVPPLACATSANIDVTTTAVNVLGEGPLSDPTIIGKDCSYCIHGRLWLLGGGELLCLYHSIH